MTRKNIFEILENKWNIIDEIKRIYHLLNYNCIELSIRFITPIEFADTYCFLEWKNRYSYLNIEDMADDLSIELDEDTACKVIEYNHYLLKGDIDKKKEILLQLASKYEGIKSNIKNLNSKLDDDIGFMLNNVHIRHNNKSVKSKKEYVSKMRKDTMEKWYDETYQMLLLAFLLNEQSSRSEKIGKLKEKIKN